MDQDNIKMFIDIGQFLITGGIGVWLYIDRKNDRTNVRIDDLEDELDKRLDDHAKRLATIEANQKNAVTHSDLNRLGTEVASTKALLQSVKEQLDRIQNWLINSK
jgi:hypothetical protein